MPLQPAHSYAFGPYRLDAGLSRLERAGAVVPVSPKAFDLLLLLARSPERVLSKSELMEALWPKTFVEDANLTQHVYTLRRALGDRPDGAPYIETVPRRGYRLNADVRAWHAGESGCLTFSASAGGRSRCREAGHDTCRARWRTQAGHRSALRHRECRSACRASRAGGPGRGNRSAWPTSPARKSPAMRGSSAGVRPTSSWRCSARVWSTKTTGAGPCLPRWPSTGDCARRCPTDLKATRDRWFASASIAAPWSSAGAPTTAASTTPPSARRCGSLLCSSRSRDLAPS